MKFAFVALLFSSALFASPVPMTSSSRAVAPYWGLYVSPLGYAVDARNSGWKVAEIPEPGMPEEHWDAAYRLPGSQGLLTLRIDQDKKVRNPKAYMQVWTALYNRLGFEILGNRPFTQGGATAYVVDLIRKDKNRQGRQAIFFRDDQAVVISCQDEIDPFRNSINECNKVIRTFRWLDSSVQTPSF